MANNIFSQDTLNKKDAENLIDKAMNFNVTTYGKYSVKPVVTSGIWTRGCKLNTGTQDFERKSISKNFGFTTRTSPLSYK